VFRVDHYLGKEGVQNLLALRFGNALFEPLWNARHIEQVQITVAETVGVEGRGDYYDHSGAMRDMLQNHLLQLLCLTAMEPPSAVRPERGAQREAQGAAQSLRPIGGDDAAPTAWPASTAPARSTASRCPATARNSDAPATPKPSSRCARMIDNWRWSGVPFYLRTGKRLPRRCTEIYLQFRAVPHSIFGATGAHRAECAADPAAAGGRHRADA
jgi:glucose-6-phosphate 1-dehydrogenase